MPEGDPTYEVPLTGVGAGQTAALALPQSPWRGGGQSGRLTQRQAGRPAFSESGDHPSVSTSFQSPPLLPDLDPSSAPSGPLQRSESP